ncbi:MAG: glycoside hydrolase family 3 protein, partial [Deltaproteobacteria bacterium]|nr:glycoside hydrolase family 3 protein [Deltaproteobacteria bacterium]
MAKLGLTKTVVIIIFIMSGCSGSEEGTVSMADKVGQLFMIGFQGKTMTSETEALIRTIRPGGVILFGRNIENADQLMKLIQDLQDLSMEVTGLPLLVSTDQEGGKICRIKWLDDKVPEADITTIDQAYETGLKRGVGLKDLGINLNLAPVLDMCVDGDFLTKYDRCFQGTPEEIGELGENVILGQRAGGIMSVAKHFPGYGGIIQDPETVEIAVEDEIPEIEQFQVAEAATPEFVMAVVDVIYQPIDPDLSFAISPHGINFLREEIAGDYLIISDDLATETMKNKYS